MSQEALMAVVCSSRELVLNLYNIATGHTTLTG